MLIAHAVGSKKDIPGSVDFSDVQIMHKLAGWVTPNLDFKVMIFFNVIYLNSQKRYKIELYFHPALTRTASVIRVHLAIWHMR